MKILHKLKNHEDSINSLAWFPAPINDDNTDLQKIKSFLNVDNLNMVLCSSSDDKTVRVWCASQGIQLKLLKIPSSGNSSSSRGSNTQNKISFTPLCWPCPRYIVTGSFRYALLE